MAGTSAQRITSTRRSRPAWARRLAALTALLVSASLAPAVIAAPAQGAAPVGQGFTLNAGDLKFILKQIKIAENHATREGPNGEPVAGQPLIGTGPLQIASPLLPYGLRSVDGSENNLVPGQEKFGAASEIFPRLTMPTFKDAEVSPFGPPSTTPTSYNQKSGLVIDSQPRVISNLIVDQTSTNPAAVKAAGQPHRTFLGEPATPCDANGLPSGCTPAHQTLFIPNVTTDVGLSPPFNSWFTLFGQFFDHGVDLTVKGGSGTVFVPLKADDPLIPGPDHVLGTTDDLDPNLRFMALTRATNLPGDDGVLGTTDDVHDARNIDSPWVDQSQTYTSHPSHQVFMREYVRNAAGRPVATGQLLKGPDGGMATWATVKSQAAALLGIKLVDADIFNIPLLATDQYGRFLRGKDRGLPQLATASGLVEGDTANPVAVPGDSKRTGIAFLDDIAHHAVPKSGLTPDSNTTVQAASDPHEAGSYDDEMLNVHFVAGDGRVNENIGLTAIHQVFHSEHNRLVSYVKNLITTQNIDVADWQLGAGVWNGERLFQAARFVTEMEYQHLVFEEFARKVQPGINPFNVFTQSDTAINPAVMAEFAHAVYRFGHSMLTDTVARTRPDGSSDDIPLLEGFLNPPAYTNNGALTPEQAAGQIAMGMTDQVGNELDEFVTETLRNNLLGLPLDLPTINMTRAREAGIPSLNNLRKQLYVDTNDSSLQPYSDWVDFGLSLKHTYSVVNFMAAYGQHPTIKSATTLVAKRAAAQLIYDNDPALHPATPADSSDFVNSEGIWATGADGKSKTGVDDIDLWIGGLAESQNLFGGLLGSTFNYVFERQLTDLQDGDRLYYLSRTSGLNLRTQLEGNSFAELVMRNTDASSLKAEVFSLADCEFELKNLQGTGNLVADDPNSGCNEEKRLIRMADGTIRYRQTNSEDPPGLNAQSTYNGTALVDRIWGGVDNDTFWGNDGNDIIEGGDGADTALGGDGNDIITDLAGDDVHKGGDGNDAIDAGPGLDVIMSGNGKDFTNGGLNANETFAGEGDDFVIAGAGPDTVFGGGGDDWQEGGNGNDLLQGDSGAPFFDDINKPGHDVLIGGSNEDDYDSEGGDDIQVAGPGIERNHGTYGFDWAIHARSSEPGVSDLTISIAAGPAQLADRFLLTEALSGWSKDDILRGDDMVPFERDVELHGPWGANALNEEGIARIEGLAAIVAGNTECRTDPAAPNPEGEGGGAPTLPAPATVCGFGAGNILIGGGGSDLIQGRGADDIIDGDSWLNVRLVVRDDPADPNRITRSANSMSELQADVFAGRLDPGNIFIKREILNGNVAGDIDTAVYTGAMADYDIDNAGGGSATVVHVRNLPPCCADQGGPKGDGTDTLKNIERLQFSDQTIELANIATNTPATGTVTLSSATPTEGQALTLTNTIADADGIASPIVFTWQSETSPGTWTPVFTGNAFIPGNPEVGKALRVVATFTDGDGVLESITSAPTALVINVNQPATGAPVINDATPQEALALLVNTDAILDPDGLVGVTFNHQWQQSNLGGGGAFGNIVGASGASFTPGQAQVNRALRVVVSFVDNHGTAQQVMSAPTGVVGDLFIGTAGPDTWTGTAGDDRAFGGGGNDVLNAGGGNDVVAGEAGDDNLNLGAGDDVAQVTGPGQGFDAVVGAAGIDRIEALANNTEIGLRSIASLEQATADSLSGLFTGVRIIGSAANDTLNFGAVTLTSIVEINGGAGADTLTGSDAADVIVGGPGDDALAGAGGDDVFVTAGVAHGFDAVTGGAGVDRVEAVAGNVRIGLRSVASLERITSGGNPNVGVLGSTGNDTLNFGGVTFSGISDVDANAGTDNVTGSAAADALFGGAGNDTINGGGGVDSITGGIGNDTMNGGAGNDFFRFGAGFGADTVAGFDANATGGQDLLDVSALGITAANFGSSVTISAVAGGTRLTIGTNTITLNGVAPATVSSADFVLA